MLIEVVAAALFDTEGRVLIAQRPPGKSSAGRWEFPGGKREPGESLFVALQRELAEELDIEVELAHCTPMLQLDHESSERTVRLHFYRVESWRGEVRAREGQRLEWLLPASFGEFDILEADRPFLDMLQGVNVDGADDQR